MTFAFKVLFLALLELCLFVEYDLAPLFYVKPIPETEIQILGTISSVWQERSSFVTGAPALAESVIKTENIQDKNVEETKRDVSLEELLTDDSRKREKRINKDKKSVDGETRLKKLARTQKKSVNSSPTSTVDLRWPSGTYGLPKPVNGCPTSDDFEWKTGYRFHDTEDDGTENQHSDSFHLAGEFSDEGIKHEFCIKLDDTGEGRWPDGKYCIYKKGSRCPAGLDEGFVIWDDENKDNKNSKDGELPEGLFNEDTKIFFCCSITGSAGKEITLPNKAPFFLFAYDSYLCQKVKGMRVETEFVKFDDEDRGNIDYEGGEFPFGIHRAEKDHMFFLCYYTPEGQNNSLVPDKKSNNSSSSKNVIHKDGFKKHKTKSEDKQVDKLEELEKLRNSEKMMDAFLASTASHNKETNKNERTKTIIKTIRVPERENTTSIVVTTAGIVLGIVVLGAVVGIVVIKHIRSNRDGIKVDSLDEQVYTASSRRSSFTTSEDEVELTEADFEDELVEDQYLPSDSELKSGLELMFLKQQRHYWTRKKKP
ncbi:uncharacterized protein LOC111340085 [Stylophora pistillata]|uniref:Apextrin C-terminal domain-containing protein n=1 Tax=Stylophora pistillata TaxID=50429 RepID=A0A2B4RHZ8_STYPI|nr:uncharacterized protein LOC111340085 [Stylophora pistillata]PFX18014.1 hypothetical protein AWC38_SpisGene17643 [Stylophora pistillata]